MAENRSRFVLLCQQSLALAVVVAIAAPAANMVSLDIVAPPHAAQTTPSAQPPAATNAAPAGTGDVEATPALVASRPVKPIVSTVPLVGVTRAGLQALGQPSSGTTAHTAHAAQTDGATATLAAAETTGKDDQLTVLSTPQRVAGLATVGVTWAPGSSVPDQEITISVRTKTGATWSRWTSMPYHDDHGPDPSSAEARHEKPGTDSVYIGRVDDVQIKAMTASGEVPQGMKLALVDPGKEVDPTVESPAIDTSRLGPDGGRSLSADDAPPGGTAGVSLSAATTAAAATTATSTAKPEIFSRAQWGADERMRDKSALHYGEVHGGFIHHTVNANDYTRAQVPAIIRGIYAYHTQSRGWSDVGYNFLVDRFGRIWEGRYGGVGRPVVGAHTLGYNDDSFAMSAIGNYELVKPSRAVIQAYGRLFAWKLSLSGVRPNATNQWIEKQYLPAIDGHRDVGQTACPGTYLYAKIPRIRRLATADQQSFAPRVRDSNLAGVAAPDLVVRKASTKQAYIVRSTGRGTLAKVTPTGTYFRNASQILNAGDWDGDGRDDVITRSGASGRLYLYRGKRGGKFAKGVLMSTKSFASVTMLTAPGDYTGDGHPDLLGQPSGGNMRIYPGNGKTGLKKSYIAHSGLPGLQQVGLGLWDGDGAPDSLIRRSNGALVLYPGNGPGGLTGGTRIGKVGAKYDWMLAVGDLTGDGRTDLVVRSVSDGHLYVYPGASAGGFASREKFGGGDLRRFDLAG